MARDNGILLGSLCSSHKQPSQPQKMEQPFDAAPGMYRAAAAAVVAAAAAGRDITWLASVKWPIQTGGAQWNVCRFLQWRRPLGRIITCTFEDEN